LVLISSDREISRAEHLRHIRAVHSALAPALDIVFIGGKVMSLYAKLTGDTLRTTTDVDTLVVTDFGPRQRAMEKLIARRVIAPDPTGPPCRYELVGTGVNVDLVVTLRQHCGERS
jgi:hypothetical protein